MSLIITPLEHQVGFIYRHLSSFMLVKLQVCVSLGSVLPIICNRIFFLVTMVCHISSLPYVILISSLVEGLILQCLPGWPRTEEIGHFLSQSSRLPQRCKKHNLRDHICLKQNNPHVFLETEAELIQS